MGRNTRRRATGTRSGTFVAVALMLGGGVLVTANVFASATEGDATGAPDAQTVSAAPQAFTVDCPDVGNALTSVPEGAKEEVDRELASLDGQIAEAYQRLKETSAAQQQDAAFTDNAILGPLKDKRAATIARILEAIDRAGTAHRASRISPRAACAHRRPESMRPTGSRPHRPGTRTARVRRAIRGRRPRRPRRPGRPGRKRPGRGGLRRHHERALGRAALTAAVGRLARHVHHRVRSEQPAACSTPTTSSWRPG